MPLESAMPPAPVAAPTDHINFKVPLSELKPTNYANTPINEIWVMFYRHGMSYMNFKFFRCKGDLAAAKERAERHAKVMGYTRGVFVRPLIVDIDFEERWKIEKGVDPIGG